MAEEKKKKLDPSFDVQEYSHETQLFDKRAIIYKIIEQMHRESPVFAVRSSFVGEKLKLTYHCYEMFLPTRIRTVTEQAEMVFKETEKYLKAEYKKLAKETLTLKQDKDLADYTTEKLNLNERYHYCSWRYYDID